MSELDNYAENVLRAFHIFQATSYSFFFNWSSMPKLYGTMSEFRWNEMLTLDSRGLKYFEFYYCRPRIQSSKIVRSSKIFEGKSKFSKFTETGDIITLYVRHELENTLFQSKKYGKVTLHRIVKTQVTMLLVFIWLIAPI